MAALVQAYPQQTATVGMLHSRPNSASGMLQPHQNQQYSQGGAQPRNNYNGIQQGSMGGPVVYRGSVGPVQPYAFTSTPSLNQTTQWRPSATSTGSYRASSTSAVPQLHNFDYSQNGGHNRYLASASMTNLPATSNYGLSAGGSRDDSSLVGMATRRTTSARPHSALIRNAPTLSPTGTSFAATAHGTPAKPSPERYRRPAPQQQQQQQQQQLQPTQRPTLQYRRNSAVGSVSSTGTEESQLNGSASSGEAASRRARRLSMPALHSAEFAKPQHPTPLELDFARQKAESSRYEQSGSPRLEQKPTARVVSPASDGQFTRPVHARTGSSDSRASARSNSSRPSSQSTNRKTIASGHVPTGNPAPGNSGQNPAAANPDYRQVNVPPRTSSSDAANTKRTATPSPLSKPVTMDAAADKVNRPATTNHGAAAQQAAKPESPAVKQLAAINGKQPKSKTSRLRRAFSFGGNAEFRKAGAPDADVADNTSSPGPARLHKDPTPEEMYDAEQERIAQQQEAAGLGTNIYSGGKMFMSSTDNISVSSTASSASIMIRKMGRGMKKGGRSLVGLFRPKSIIGVPPPDSRSSGDGSQTAVSMITVEAERERINVNPDPTHPGGGTGFPRLERNSIDTSKASTLYDERPQSAGTHGSVGRKSIVGGEKERAEVLAAVRKGILKRNGSSTPPPKTDSPPRFTDSPVASLPGTPNDEAQGHRRTDSINIGNEDYFVSALRLRQDTKSAPGTPQGQNKRCATFSPRIIFHDTWPSGEYDRRGDIATCNRLTPMLAQQIKEELNTFKMEMEVHETSKIYTHFF